jgi:hypothetical protein
MSLVRTLRAAIVLGLALATGAGLAADKLEAVPGEILVKVRSRATQKVHAQIAADAQADSDEHLAEVGGGAIRKLRVRGDVSIALRNLSATPGWSTRSRTTSFTPTPSRTIRCWATSGA